MESRAVLREDSRRSSKVASDTGRLARPPHDIIQAQKKHGRISLFTVASGARGGTGILPVDARQAIWAKPSLRQRLVAGPIFRCRMVRRRAPRHARGLGALSLSKRRRPYIQLHEPGLELTARVWRDVLLPRCADRAKSSMPSPSTYDQRIG